MDAAWVQPRQRLCAGGPREITARSAEDRCGAVLSSGQAVGTEAHVVRRRQVIGGIDALKVDTVGACVAYTPSSFCRRKLGVG